MSSRLCALVVFVFVFIGVVESRRELTVPGRALVLLIGLAGIGAGLPLLLTGAVGFAISFALFGATFLSVVTATTNLVRLARPRAEWARGIAGFTLVFGIGQILGPVASGAVADLIGSTDGVLWTSAGLLLLGAAVAARQRPVR